VLFSELLYGGIGIQNRGQNGAGMVVGGNGCTFAEHRQDGLIKDIFISPVTLKFQSINKWGIVQCRYGTNGNYCPENNQPCIITTSDGTRITVAHNGEFVGLEKYKDDLNMSDTRVFTKLLANSKGNNWDDRVKDTINEMEGAFSLIIGIGDSLYVARDKFGIRPLLIASIEDGWALASETPSFDNIQASLIREIKPGEISKISNNRFSVLKKGNFDRRSECIFEFPYTRSPQSLYCDSEGIWRSIYEFRQRSGVCLARQFRELNLEIDFVVGIPESGIPIAEGFHNELEKPVNNVIMKKPSQYYLKLPTRTFMNDQFIKDIPSTVLQKLSFVPDKKIYEGKRIACVDDSVVRSSTSKIIVETLLNLGAKSVDWVSGLPMVVNSCHLGISIRTKEELIAFQKHCDSREIAKAIGVRSITFITAENIIRAANNDRFIKPKNEEDVFKENGFCGGCLGGIYPVNKK
jgi:amidophosphoribosyltransferase